MPGMPGLWSERLSMDADNVIRWGIIGCGDVTEVKSGPALNKIGGSELTAVMRRDADKAADYAKRHGVPSWYSSADELINDPAVNAIYIATPPSSHAEYAIQAAEAGKPVLCEKPLAVSLYQCELMDRACEKNNVKLTLAFYRRALPRFEKLREIVTSGVIGDPRVVQVRQYRNDGSSPQAWKTDPDVNGGGLFVDMQTHTLDWLDHTFGNAVTATGVSSNQGGRFDCEDTVSATVEYYNGMLANFDCCYDAGHNEESVTIVGTRGKASMPFFSEGPITLTSNGVTDTIVLPDPPHVHQPFLEKTVAYFRDGGENPCDAAAGWRNIELIKAMVVGD